MAIEGSGIKVRSFHFCPDQAPGFGEKRLTATNAEGEVKEATIWLLQRSKTLE
mgnify:CR=1 FL=1